MSQTKTQWTITALVALVAVLTTLLVVEVFRGTPVAYAQSEGVSANYVIGLLGQEQQDRVPLFVIDTKAQTVLVYEYIFTNRQLFLRVARSFASDRQLTDDSWGRNNIYEGPTVRDVQELIRRRSGGR